MFALCLSSSFKTAHFWTPNKDFTCGTHKNEHFEQLVHELHLVKKSWGDRQYVSNAIMVILIVSEGKLLNYNYNDRDLPKVQAHPLWQSMKPTRLSGPGEHIAHMFKRIEMV